MKPLLRSAILLAAIACALPGCSKKSGGGSSTTAATSLADLSKEVGLTFPASARLIHVSRENGMDDLVRFKVQMSRGDVAAFLASTPVPADSFEPGERGLLGPDQGDWDPGKANKLRTGQATLPGARALNLGVVEEPSRAIVYVVNHGT